MTDRAGVRYCIPIDRERLEFECFLLRSYGISDDRTQSACLECQIELLLRGKKCLSPFFTEGEVEDFFKTFVRRVDRKDVVPLGRRYSIVANGGL